MLSRDLIPDFDTNRQIGLWILSLDNLTLKSSDFSERVA